MSKPLQKRDNNLFKQLVPLKSDMQEIITTYNKANLIVQIDCFSCVGIVISICINHVILDEATAGYFVKSWAEIVLGGNNIKGCGKHFMFDGGKIVALREKIGSGPHLNHLARFEAIASLISGVLIKSANRGTHEFTSKQIAAVIAINLRSIVNPPLPL
ncbi:putative 3'-N-debenzoyl-2'-deoxytaxol N-benzoyltransferase [Melia azedarach]|uniref:3'-N-debenzoyl-2'-deoxytaxol N-benzoyltransferase n=1 Tax=Melia azedarach TaxID=155640 RepID=A0ACC1Y6J8_MELAZ|nr:putative 3'-N-debenzoyl-2'-deoxytaxol N-benzoyltransferase [Melia azedarach]